MRIAIVNNQSPFVRGGAELLAGWLRDKLQEYGHSAEVVRIPFQWHPPENIVNHMLAARLIRIPNVDRVVAFKFPAYYVPHDNKLLWLLHQFRQAYDLWGTRHQDIPDTRVGHQIRRAIIAADNVHLPESRRIYTNSVTVGHRLRRYNGIDSEVLFPPLPRTDAYRCEEYGDFFFLPGRITAGKRQHVVAEAMVHATSSARLIIAGQPETPEDLARLTSIIREHKLEARVQVLPHWISEEDKIALFSRARGVIYIPVDEDSYGYVTLEAFHAHKPVITFADSGGTHELVIDTHNGRIVHSMHELAGAMDELATDSRLCERMGDAAFATIERLNISWDRVITCLTR